MAKPDPSVGPSPGQEFMVPENVPGLLIWLEKKRNAGKSRTSEQEMRQNMAFMLGQQWISWDARQGAFRQATAHRGNPNAPVRITANKIASLAERSIAKLTKAAPEPEARPVSDSETDLDAAKVSTRILDHELYRLKWDRWLTQFWFWPTTLGWSYAMVWWDPKAGPIIGSDDSGELHRGEVVIEEVPAPELRVDPSARTMEEARWACRTTSLTREAVWERYGKVPEDAEGGRSLADEVYGMTDVSSTRPGAADGAQDGQFIKVHQMWIRPGSRSAPKGMVITWAGKTILQGPLPYPYKHGKLPFVQGDLLPGLGRREGRTWVTDLIPLQVDYNDARSREATIRRILTPKVLSPTGSIDPRRVTSRVEIIEYAPVGDKPTMMIPDSGWMAQFEAGMNRADSEMGDRAGQQDVNSGQPASGSMPAAAILALQEADDTRLAISAKLLAAFIAETGWQLLQLVRQFWDEKRTVRVWSEDGTLEVQKFMGSDVSEALDVHVSSESALPKSKAARAQITMDLIDRKIITDPRIIIRMLDVPGTDFLLDAISKDARKANVENGQLHEGEQVPVASFDNHAVHITEHTDEMKEPWYAKAEQTDPARVAFDAHLAVHHELMAPPGGVIPGAPPMLGPDGLPVPPGGQPAGQDYLDPMTGKPPDPTQVAAGQAPSSLASGPSNIRADVGANAMGGAVPGIPADVQAAHTGN